MAAPELRAKSTQPRALAALGLLSLLWALGSLRSDLLGPIFHSWNLLPTFERLALPLVLFALAAAAFAVIRKSRWPRGLLLLDALLVSLGLFIAPGILLFLAGARVSDLTRVVLFSLTPVFASVLEPHFGRTGTPQSAGSLVAPLIAVAGTLFLFPFDLPQSLAAASAFAAVLLAVVCIAAANCYAVRIASFFPPAALLPFAVVASGAAALAFAAIAICSGTSLPRLSTLLPELLWSTLIDLPALALLFWLLRRLSATRMTTRFLIAPLFANLIALALFHPSTDLRAILGILLVTIGSGWILLTPHESPSSGTSQLNLPNE